MTHCPPPLSLLLPLLLALSLTGCSGAVSNLYRGSAYSLVEVRAISTLPVEVMGPVAPEAVVAAMPPASSVGLRDFVPIGPAGSHYRMVWLFGPGGSHPDSVCTAGKGDSTTSPGPLAAAVCRGPIALSYATADITEAPPGSAGFKQVVGAMTRALFAPEDWDRQNVLVGVL